MHGRCFLDAGMIFNPQSVLGMQFMSTQVFCTIKDIPMNGDVELDILDMFFNVVPFGIANASMLYSLVSVIFENDS